MYSILFSFFTFISFSCFLKKKSPLQTPYIPCNFFYCCLHLLSMVVLSSFERVPAFYNFKTIVLFSYFTNIFFYIFVALCSNVCFKKKTLWHSYLLFERFSLLLFLPCFNQECFRCYPVIFVIRHHPPL